MARSEAGRQLTERHRVAQIRLGGALTEYLKDLLLQLLVYESVGESAAVFARVAAAFVMEHRQESRRLSVEYTREFAAVEAPRSELPAFTPDDDDVEIEEIEEALQVAVRVAVKQSTAKGRSREEAVEAAVTAAVGKGVRFVQDGGRRVLEEYTAGGWGPVGYARVVDADPCPFCAMLASRGVSYAGGKDGEGLYRTDSFQGSNARFIGDGRFKVHDHCACTLEPVYRVGGKVNLPGNGDQLAWEWAEIAAGDRDPMGAWRRWRESGTLPEDYDGPLEGKRRRKPPVAGQREGRGSKSTPAKASERSGGVKKAADWGKADYLAHAKELRGRLRRLDGEVDAMRAAGARDDDIQMLALLHQRKGLLSRIRRYEDAAARVKE